MKNWRLRLHRVIFQSDTKAGKAFENVILGYGIIAVPTGIVTVELTRATPRQGQSVACPACGKEGHDQDARFCKICGSRL